jgi:hypothetical protein
MNAKLRLLPAMILWGTILYGQTKLPELADARSKVTTRNLAGYFAKKYGYTENDLTIDVMGSTGNEVFLSQTKAGEYFEWPNDKAVIVFQMTTPKDADGIWYSAQAHIVYVKSECITPFDCYRLSDWKFIDALVTYETVNGATKLENVQVTSLVLDYLSDNVKKQELLDQSMAYKPHKKLGGLIRLDSVVIWDEDVLSPNKREVDVHLYGIEAAYNDEVSQIKQLNPVVHSFTGIFIKNDGWELTNMEYYGPSYDDQYEPDGNLYNYLGQAPVMDIYQKYDIIFPDPKSEFVMDQFAEAFFKELGDQPDEACADVADMMLPEDHQELQQFFGGLLELGFSYQLEFEVITSYYEKDSPKNQIERNIEIKHPKPKPKILGPFAQLGIKPKYVEQMKRSYKTDFRLKFDAVNQDGKWYAKLSKN